MAFDDAPLSQVLQALADYQQLNLVVASGVEGSLSIRLHNVPWVQALDLVAQMGKLSIERQDNIMLVRPESWQQEKVHQETLRQKREEDSQPLHTLMLTLHYADVENVNASLKAEREKLMTPRGSITVDSRTNSLLLRDTAVALEETRRWVTALDQPLQQIELTSHIVTVTEDSLRELGVNWAMSADEQVNRALRASQLQVNLAAGSPALTTGLSVARLDGRLLNLELSALEQENKLEIIASPRLFTSHQQTASIKQGTEIPYEVSSGSNGSTSVEFKEAVLGMEVIPVIQPNGRIMLKIHISQNLPGSTLRSGTGEYIAIDKQEIQTQVTVKDGQTLALGGIFQQQNARGKNNVPLLGNLPVIGALFRHSKTAHKRRELVIFITPRLIGDE
ncbi:porin [Erwinia tracheiphila]|uniref:Porin n=1 Tax=Erwinia tracheiphila TaxID=65700 RepID=A0A0M2KJH8_9GAMM|nr:outer membrane porin HofQ [Erwinia tracheiphila PSU-1]KKF37166.1 porin [Erwinia tracheiphila]